MQKNPAELTFESISIEIDTFLGPKRILTARQVDDSEFEANFFASLLGLNKLYDALTPCDPGCQCAKSQFVKDPSSIEIITGHVTAFDGLLRSFYSDRNYIMDLLTHKNPYDKIISQQRDNYLAILHRCAGIVKYLCMSNLLETALAIVQPLVKILSYIATELEGLKPKQLKAIKLFQQTVEMDLIVMMREFSYCLLQLGHYEDAAIKSAEAKQALSNFIKGSSKSGYLSFDLFHNSILALYHLQKNDTKLARKFLDETTRFVYIEKDDEHRATAVDHIYACDQLAEMLLQEKNYSKAVYYHQLAKKMLGWFLNHSPPEPLCINDKTGNYLYRCDLDFLVKFYRRLQDNAPRYLELLFMEQAETVVKRLEKFTHLFVAPHCTANKIKQAVELHFASLDSAKNIFRYLLLLGNKTCRIDAQNNKILITDLDDTDLDLVVAALNRFIENQAKETQIVQPKTIKSPAPQNANQPVESTTKIDQAVRDSFALYKPAPIKKKAIKETEIAQKPEATIATTTLKVESNPIMQLAQQLHIPVDTIFSLGHPPYIPHGYWYAHLNLQLDEQLNKEVRAVLNRGQLTGRGQAIKPAKKEVTQKVGAATPGQKNYTYKLRLLGPKGKGDIRVYGWVKTIDAQRKLIVLDHIEMDAHKKLSLPDSKVHEPTKKPAGPSQ